MDLIVERADGSVTAVEIKPATTTHQADTEGLRFLERRIAGIVFYTGPLTGKLDERIWFTPIPRCGAALSRPQRLERSAYPSEEGEP